jgi:hypothetical protein
MARDRSRSPLLRDRLAEEQIEVQVVMPHGKIVTTDAMPYDTIDSIEAKHGITTHQLVLKPAGDIPLVRYNLFQFLPGRIIQFHLVPIPGTGVPSLVPWKEEEKVVRVEKEEGEKEDREPELLGSP